MSKGYLFGLREQWRQFCGGQMLNPYETFLNQFGDKTVYCHIGLDSTQTGMRREYQSQPYAIFRTNGARVAFTLTDLQALATYAQGHRLPSVRRNMERQLGQAIREYEAHAPYANHDSMLSYRHRDRRLPGVNLLASGP